MNVGSITFGPLPTTLRGICPNSPRPCFCTGACYGNAEGTITIKTTDLWRTPSPVPPIKIDLSLRKEFV